jgi:hypothetical protein
MLMSFARRQCCLLPGEVGAIDHTAGIHTFPDPGGLSDVYELQQDRRLISANRHFQHDRKVLPNSRQLVLLVRNALP